MKLISNNIKETSSTRYHTIQKEILKYLKHYSKFHDVFIMELYLIFLHLSCPGHFIMELYFSCVCVFGN